MGLIDRILEVNVIDFIYYNYFCKQVERKNGAKLIPYRGTRIELRQGAKIVLNAPLSICTSKVKGSKAEAYVQLYENSTLIINGRVTLAYGAMLQAHHDAKITIGKCAINTWATLIADKEISIGQDCLISRGVTIFDSDFHPVLNEKGERANEPAAVILDDHVWVGVKTTILRGVHIKTGAAIGANALVTADVKEKAMVSAIPGRAFGYIEWRTE